jgi:hypothetical protein
MSVFILKEGKEYTQGVAYLDDGTMVVVDNARQRIGQNGRHCRDERVADDGGPHDFRQVPREWRQRDARPRRSAR